MGQALGMMMKKISSLEKALESANSDNASMKDEIKYLRTLLKTRDSQVNNFIQNMAKVGSFAEKVLEPYKKRPAKKADNGGESAPAAGGDNDGESAPAAAGDEAKKEDSAPAQ